MFFCIMKSFPMEKTQLRDGCIPHDVEEAYTFLKLSSYLPDYASNLTFFIMYTLHQRMIFAV